MRAHLRSRLNASGSVGEAGTKVTVHVVSTMSETQVKVPGGAREREGDRRREKRVTERKREIGMKI